MMAVTLMAALAWTSCKQEAKKEDSKDVKKEVVASSMTKANFGVRGNCGMCKNTIETAAKSIDGVAEATWDKAKKELQVSFDGAKTDLAALHKAVAASGYDTDKMVAGEEAYSNLAGCCQYDRAMKMSLKEGETTENTH